MLDLKSEVMRGPGSIPTGVTFFSKFYNPNLHNIARSDRMMFKTKNPSDDFFVVLKCKFPPVRQ